MVVTMQSAKQLRTLGAASLLAMFAMPAAAAGPAADYFATSPVKADTTLDFPVERVPGRALVKLHGGDGETQLLLANLEARTGIALQLVRPSLLG
jgi:hypothetical protein